MNIQHDCLFIILSIIAVKSALGDRCDAWNMLIPEEARYTCYQQDIRNECKYETKSTMKIHDPKLEEGTVDLEFDFDNNCEYTLKVSFWENANEEDCDEQDEFENQLDQHSIYSYRGISEINNEISQQNCSKKGHITVKYLFTACYIFKLFNNKSEEQAKSQRYLTFPQQKLTYLDFNSESFIHMDHRSSDSKTILEIIHPFVKYNPYLYLKLNCINCATPSIGIFKIIPTVNEFNTDYNLFCNHIITNITISCKTNGLNSNTILCYVKGLTSGLYEVLYDFKNLIRCPPLINGYWGFCTNEGTKDIIDVLPGPVKSPPNKTHWEYYIIAGLLFTFILLLAFVIYRLKYKRLDDSDVLMFPYMDNEALIGKGKILLLYPKDADIVMETMESLRNAFKSEGFEVFDIYDRQHQKSIDEIGKKWIVDKLCDKYMKTVIIQTYCGEILTNSLHPAAKLYKKPTCYDDLFPYALSLIRARVDPNSYTKLFIVNMGFDQMEYSQFSFLNPSVRYGLPQNFQELIRDLCLKRECSIDINKTENELSQFKFMYKQMNNFIDDPNYLSEILNVSVFKLNEKIEVDESSFN